MTGLFTVRENKELVAQVREYRALHEGAKHPRSIKVRLSSRGETYHTEASLYRTIAAHRALARDIIDG